MTCPACGSSDIHVIESIETTDLVNAWSRNDARAGEFIKAYVASGKMPPSFVIQQCSQCDLEFADPMFAASSDWYEIIEKYGDRWEYAQTLRDIGLDKKRILDIGCGQGHFVMMAASAGHEAHGIDFNEKAIEVAKGKGISAEISDLAGLRDRGEMYDVATFFHVIEHLETPQKFLTELAQLVPAGGTIHFSCPGPNRFTTHLLPHLRLGKRDTFDYPPLHQTRWNPKAASQVLERTGWEMLHWAEEPYAWKGTAVMLLNSELQLQGHSIDNLNPLTRKSRILLKMISTFRASRRYRGMTAYYVARRK